MTNFPFFGPISNVAEFEAAVAEASAANGSITVTKPMLIDIASTIWQAATAVGGKPGEITDRFINNRTADMIEHFMQRGDLETAGRLGYMMSDANIETTLTCMGLGQWADCGFPQVEMGHKFAASLLCSDVSKDALETVRKPWRSFLIEVPDQLLLLYDNYRKTNVSIRRIMVSHIDNKHGQWSYVAWTSGNVSIWRYGVHPATLLPPLDAEGMMNNSHSTLEVTDEDSRVSSLVGRLIINTCLSMSSPDLIKEVGPGHPIWIKAQGNPFKMKGHTRNFRVGKPVVIDLREHVAGFVRGEKRKIEVRTLVRGHFKRQHYGAGNLMVKVIWREPFWRGPEEAEVAVRPHLFKDDQS